jgi:hypothetical protein
VTLHAIFAWCLVAPLAVGMLYLAIKPAFRRLSLVVK